MHEKSSVASHAIVRCRHSITQHNTLSIRGPRERNQVPNHFTKETSHNTVHRQVGVNYNLNHLCEKYHGIHSCQLKRCIQNCYKCKRHFLVHHAKQQMAPLPQFCLEMTYRLFTICTTDFVGPYLTIQGCGRVQRKRYLCLFLYPQMHCCHSEMAIAQDTTGFLNLFTRMAAGSGWPRMMLSDKRTKEESLRP